MTIVIRAFLRYLFRRRGLSLLQLLGIAFGVASVVGLVLSARTSLASFGQAVDFLAGKASHSIQRPAGPLDESLLRRLIEDPAVEALAPVIDRRLSLGSDITVRLLGIDPFLDRTIRPSFFLKLPTGAEESDREPHLAFFFEPGTVLMDASLARQLAVIPGDTLDSSKGTIRILATFPNPSPEPIVLMDIGQAQELFDLRGRLDRVDLIVSDEAAFLKRWESGFHIQSGRQRKESLNSLLRAFRLNLEALSLMALFVGIFLIYNTAMFTVVSRRRDAGILRSLGASRSEILTAYLTETLLLGALGGALGGWLGFQLSRILTALVGNTVSDLYFFLKPAAPDWSLSLLISALLLGCSASLLGAAFPVIELLRADPARILSGRIPDRSGGRGALRVALGGAGLLGLSLSIFLLSSGRIYLGFIGVLVFLVGSSLGTGLFLVLLHPGLKRLLSSLAGLPGKVAAGNVRQNLGRTAVAVAAFLVALSMSISLSTMIESFRHSLKDWMGDQLSGDMYISSLDDSDIPRSLYESIKAVPGVAAVDPYRNVLVPYAGTTAYVSAVDASVLMVHTSFQWAQGGRGDWEAVQHGSVIVSESFSRRFGVDSGDRITLEGAAGDIEVEVAAVFYDYTSEHGVVMMDWSTFRRIYRDTTIDSLAVFYAPDAEDTAIMPVVNDLVAPTGLRIYTRAQLHQAVLEVFDSTFAVTRSMRILTIIVAFFGIAGAILTLFMERQKEFGIYRALGFSTFQIGGITVTEALILGLISFVLSLGVGTIMAVILLKVINLQSFHWTIFYHPSPNPYIQAGFTAVSASLGAALYPLWRAWRIYPQIQIREE